MAVNIIVQLCSLKCDNRQFWRNVGERQAMSRTYQQRRRAERQDETRMILDTAIVVGIAIAVAEHETLDVEEAVLPDTGDDDGGD